MAHLWNINFARPYPLRIIQVTWNKPPQDWVKVNCDGAFIQSAKLATTGGLIRDSDGRILQSYQAYIGPASILYAELYGIWKGLDICANMNLLQVMVDSNSKVAIDIIQKNNKQWNWKCSFLLEKILVLTKRINVIFCHVYRECNAATYWLARLALSGKVSRLYSPRDGPIPLRQIAYSDKSGLVYLRKCK